MRRAFATLAVATLAVAAASAPAAAATVQLRIEGATQTLFEGPVTTTVHPVDGGDGTGAHPCSGGLGASPGPTATTALDDGARAAGIPWRGNWNPDFFDFFVESIGPDSSMPPEGYWGLLVDGASAGGGCTTKVVDGDEVLWVYGAVFKPTVLHLSGPATAAVGQPFTVSVSAAGKPVAGASVGGQVTDAAGQATISSPVPARLLLKAERADAIRSNGLAVCVGVETGCQPAGSGTAAKLTIEKLAAGELFARGAGPRLLRGAAVGVGAVELRLASHERGRCRSWNDGASAMRPTPCHEPAEFAAALTASSWQARIGRLPPGLYTLHAAALAPAPGATPATAPARVRFRVLPRRATPTSLLRRGLAYLATAQRRDGGLGTGPGKAPSLEMTGWATAALAGGAPSAAAPGITSPPPAGRASAAPAARGVAYLARQLRPGDRAADQVRSAFAAALAGTDSGLSATLCRRIAARRGPSGSVGGEVNATALAVLALQADRCEPRIAARAARWLRAQRNPDGGFGFRPGAPSDVDTTGLATWALAAVPRTRTAAREGVGFLRSAQNFDGGFGGAPGSPSNSQSTGLAIAGLRAAGLAATAPRTEDGIDPLDYLATVQRRGGAIAYSAGGRQTPVWTTAQALLGLGDRPFLRR